MYAYLVYAALTFALGALLFRYKEVILLCPALGALAFAIILAHARTPLLALALFFIGAIAIQVGFVVGLVGEWYLLAHKRKESPV